MTLVDYSDWNSGTIYDVDLNLPPEDRWKDFIDAVGRNTVQEIYHDIHELIEQELEVLPRLLKPVAKTLLAGGGRLLGMIINLFDQEYVAEIKGMAKYARVSFSKVLLANLMYDIFHIAESRSANACSSYSVNLPGGSPCMARNMDWPYPSTLGYHTVLIRFHKGKRYYISVGVVGMVGVLSAIRPGFWAVTLNQAPAAKEFVNYFQSPALQRLRAVCDSFGDYDKLVARLQEYKTMTSFFAHVVGTKKDEHVIVNSYGSEFKERWSDDPFLIQTNHFIDREDWIYNPPTEETDSDGATWVCNSRPRYNAIRRRICNRSPKSMSAAFDLLKGVPVTNEDTMQSMVLCPAKEKYLRLKVRIPSSLQ